MIGFDKGIDLSRWFVVCVNFPRVRGEPPPRTPWIPRRGPRTARAIRGIIVEDMVESQRLVADHLGIDTFAAIAGSSLGGMEVLMWTALHPERARSIICMAAAAAVPVASVAWHLIGRKLIQADPAFNGGDYYDRKGNVRGLELARMVGHMTYLSNEAMEAKFGRRRRGGTRQFEVDSYLEHQAQRFAGAYDANSYIRVQAAMDAMDLEEQFGSLAKAFERFRGKALLISFDTDWLFPSKAVTRILEAMHDARHLVISTPNGHDAFLVDYHLVNPPVREFLATL